MEGKYQKYVNLLKIKQTNDPQFFEYAPTR